MPEVRVMAEGTLRFVQASGSGNVWATASAPVSGLVAYVQSFSHTSAANYVQVSDRGVPTHHKFAAANAIDATFNCLWTGAFTGMLTASGSTVPMMHLEHRASAAEIGSNSAFYHQYHGAVLTNINFTEAAEGNTISLTFRALAMNGPTASGYIK
jgi:hypothetical protein